MPVGTRPPLVAFEGSCSVCGARRILAECGSNQWSRILDIKEQGSYVFGLGEFAVGRY